MKTLRYLLTAIMAFPLWACTESCDVEEPVYDGPTYGVYFPSQENADDLEFDPAETPVLEFTARRTDSKGAITVPFEVTASEEGIFEFEPLTFADGQEETTFSVSFPTAETGVTYECTVEITDPAYMNQYSLNAAGFEFSVTRVKWNQVLGPNGETNGTWSDSWFAAIFGGVNIASSYPEFYERDDMPGYYRVKNPYDKTLVDGLFGDEGYYEAWSHGSDDFYIDATNPEYVYMVVASTGVEVNAGTENSYGITYVGSFAKENFTSLDESSSVYGTMENGIITFPEGAIVGSLNNGFSSNYVNSDDFVIMLPGTVLYDYSLGLSNDEPADGKIDIYFTFGADVASVKYSFYEGALNSSIGASYAEMIAAGEMNPDGTINASGKVTAEFDATGTYSVLAVIMDAKNNYQGYKILTFGYVEAGDEMPVVINMGLEISDRYAAQGYTSENSAEFWAYGSDIVSLTYGIYESDKLAGMSEAAVRAMLAENGKALTAGELADLNNGGVSKILTNLSSGTYYTLAVVAGNGYVTKFNTIEAMTNGEPHPLNNSYTADDIYEIEKKDLFKTWIMWAVDYDEKTGRREPFYFVTFSESDNDFDDGQYDYDMIYVDGLACGIVEDDTHEWEYYGGFVLNYYTHQNLGLFTGSNYYVNYYPFVSSAGGAYQAFYDEIMVAGLVEEEYNGYMAMAYSGWYNLGTSPEPDGFTFNLFNDADCKQSAGYYAFRCYNIMFEDPEYSDLEFESAAKLNAKKGMTKTQFNAVANDIVTVPTNFVELRGRERAHAIIDEMKANKRIANRAVNAVDGQMPAPHKAAVKSSFAAGDKPSRSANRVFTAKAVGKADMKR